MLASRPGERHLAQRDVAEALGPLGDRLATEPQIETAGSVVIGERPDQKTFQPEFGEPSARAVEQLLAKPEALIDRMQIELEDLALERRAAEAAAAVGGITRGLAAEVEHEQRRPLSQRTLPPAK